MVGLEIFTLRSVATHNANAGSMVVHRGRSLHVIPDQLLVFPFLPLFKKLRVHDEEAERFAVFFRAFGVVRAVRAQDGAGVFAVELPEPAKTAMDVYVVA